MDVHFWLETQTKLFPEAVFLDLIHARTVGSRRVHRFVLPDAGKDPSAVLSQALTKAEADARTHGGGQQIYALTLINPETNESVSEFRLQAGEQDVGAAYDTELPTSEGIVKQLMRFNQNLHRETRSAFKEAQAALLQEHARISARCEYLETRHQEVMTLQEELLSARHDRELSALRAMRAEGRKDKALSEVATLMPVVARKFLSGGAASAPGASSSPEPAGAPSQDPLISSLGASLSEEQIRALMSILSPAQQAAAYELFLKERVAKAQAAAQEQARQNQQSDNAA